MQGFSEYIIEMGEKERRQLESCIEQLLAHYLRIKCIGGRDVPHWHTEINAWEASLFRLMTDNPGLKAQSIDVAEIYAGIVSGRGQFRGELRKQYPKIKFPDACPFTLKQIVGNRIWKVIGPKPKAPPKKK